MKEKKPKILIDFLNYLLVIKGYSIKTIDGYEKDLMLFFNFYKNYQKIQTAIEEFNVFILMQVRTADVIAFLVHLNYHRDNSPNSKQRRIVAIRRFYNWLKPLYPKSSIQNPVDNLGNISKVERLPKYIPLEKAKELETIFTCKNCVYPIRNNTILTLFLVSGIRLKELINIKIRDINFDKNTIKVNAKGHKERTIYFNDKCKKQIKEYLTFRKRHNSTVEANSLLFVNNKGQKFTADGIEYIVKKAYKLAKLDGYGYTVHTLRHTAATIMYRYVTQDLLILREFLGHKSITSTQIYTHTYNKKLIEAINKHPLNCTNSPHELVA